MKPKYSVEQILEAIEASHLPLFVICVDEEKVEVGKAYCKGSCIVASDEDGLILDYLECSDSEWGKVVINSLATALRILFDK